MRIRITHKTIGQKVPREKVYVVDIDCNMIEQARRNLQFLDNIEVVHSSFTDVKIPRKLDVIFSNSVPHWIQDYRKVFQYFREMLKPMNGNNTTIISNDGNTIVANY
jgi:trans-aconitate methyltransferase